MLINLSVFDRTTRLSQLTLIKMCIDKNISLETIYSELEYSLNSERKKIEVNNRIKIRKRNKHRDAPILCRVCKEPSVALMPVNTNRANQIDGNYKVALQCLNEKCRHTEYSRLSAGKILEKTRQEYLRNELRGK